MSRILGLAVASLSLVACGVVDPCQGIAGTCIAARVEGTATGLDQLSITLGAATKRQPEPAAAFKLPVVIGIVPPKELEGTTQDVTIAGLANGIEKARDAKSVAIVAGKKTSVTFVLGPPGGDVDGGTDLIDGMAIDAAQDFAGCVPVDPCTVTTFGMQSNQCGNMVDCGGPYVSHVSPRAAATGDRIVISGRFPSPPTSVTFSGGAAATVDAADTTRLLVKMPSTAATGPIQLVFGSGTILTPIVRKTTFPLGLQPFFPYYEQTGNARVTQVMQTARSYHVASIDRDYLYVFGGQGPASALDTIERALVNADGTLYRFETQPVTLTTPRRRATLVGFHDRVYIIGGEHGTGALSSIDTTTIAADHSVGAINDAGVTLTTGRAGAASAVIGPYVYVMGGNGLKTVERALIRSDNSLGPFQDTGLQLSDSRYGASAIVAGKSLYVIGGVGAAGYVATIDHATINADGSLGTVTPGVFDVAAQALPAARAFHTSTLIGQRIYVAGGEAMGTPLAPTAIADLTVDGDFTTAFTAAASLDTARAGATTHLIGNKLYVLGGEGGTLQAGFDQASIMGNATTVAAPMVLNGVTVPSTRIDYCMAVLGRNIYLFGGRNGTQTIEHATVNVDGSLTTFVNDAATLSNNEHSYCGTVVAGKHVYVIGGQYAAANNTTYERIPINDDGTIGTPETPVANGNPLGVGAFGITSANISVFWFAGQSYNGTTLTLPNSYIYNYAQSTNGELSTSNNQSGSLSTTNAYVRSATFGKNVFILGGNAVATSYFPFTAASGTLGAVVAGPSFVTARAQPALAYAGNKLFVFGGVNSSTAQNTYEALAVTIAGTLGASTQSAGGYFGANGFSDFHASVIDNNVYLFAGVDGSVGTSKVQRIQLQ